MLADIAVAVSPAATGVEGKAGMAAVVPRQIANANTIFNVINTLLFIGFTTWFARLAERLVPEKAVPEGVIIEPEFLDESALKVPAVALENVRHEIHRAGGITLRMMDGLESALSDTNRKRLDDVARGDDEIDILSAEIIGYLGHVRQGTLTEEESREHEILLTSIANVEGISDIIESDMIGLAREYIEGDFARGSAETRDLIIGLWDGVRQALELSVRAVGEEDQRAAQDVIVMKDEIRDLADRLFERHARRLRSDDPKYLDRVRLLLTLIEQLRHIYTLAKRIARTQLPVAIAREAA